MRELKWACLGLLLAGVGWAQSGNEVSVTSGSLQRQEASGTWKAVKTYATGDWVKASAQGATLALDGVSARVSPHVTFRVNRSPEGAVEFVALDGKLFVSSNGEAPVTAKVGESSAVIDSGSVLVSSEQVQPMSGTVSVKSSPKPAAEAAPKVGSSEQQGANGSKSSSGEDQDSDVQANEGGPSTLETVLMGLGLAGGGVGIASATSSGGSGSASDIFVVTSR